MSDRVSHGYRKNIVHADIGRESELENQGIGLLLFDLRPGPVRVFGGLRFSLKSCRGLLVGRFFLDPNAISADFLKSYTPAVCQFKCGLDFSYPRKPVRYDQNALTLSELKL